MGNWEITYTYPRDGKLTVWPGRYDNDGKPAALDFARYLPASVGTDWDARMVDTAGPEDLSCLHDIEPSGKPSDDLSDKSDARD